MFQLGSNGLPVKEDDLLEHWNLNGTIFEEGLPEQKMDSLVILVPRNDIFSDINQQTLQQQVGGVMRYVSADPVEAPDNDYPQELCIL